MRNCSIACAGRGAADLPLGGRLTLSVSTLRLQPGGGGAYTVSKGKSMSRAFVSESEREFEDDDVPEIKNPLPPGKKNLMTPSGALRLKEELRALVDAERPQAASLVARLAAAGSFDRDSLARERTRLRQIDRRIEYLTMLLGNLEVVDPAGQDKGRVLFGAEVVVSEEGEGEKVYRIVGVEESDPAGGRLSWISPVARALIGARVGDTVNLNLPGGRRSLKIVSIGYPAS